MAFLPGPLEERRRREAHPALEFRRRRAAVPGGPFVWEVLMTIQDQDVRGRAALDAASAELGISLADVQAAVRYYAEFSIEIEEQIAEADALA